MECNNYEAIRLRDIAEQKFKEGDLVDAKRFILEARQLYPHLGGALQLSAVLDVHIAAQVEVGINEPEPDYYGILLVEPLSDASTITKQYNNLALLVHPDQNKESMKEKAGAAFKFIMEALDVLSDEERRLQHDWKRLEKLTAKEPLKPTYSTHQPQHRDVKRGGMPRANPQPEPRKQEPPKATYSANQPRYKAAAQPTPTPYPQASQAPYTSWAQPNPVPGAQAFQAPYIFWTACFFCRIQYQCLSFFLNYQVVCQNCHSPFPATHISVHSANWASTFVWPPGLWGNNNPFPAGSWVNMQMNKNYLAPAYGAFTNGTFRNNLLSIFRGANPYGGYGNNLPPALFWPGILLYAMKL